MANIIYNFFKFLEDKVGKSLTPEKQAFMIVRHARELADDNVIKNLSIQDQIIYAPDTLKNKPIEKLIKNIGIEI